MNVQLAAKIVYRILFFHTFYEQISTILIFPNASILISDETVRRNV